MFNNWVQKIMSINIAKFENGYNGVFITTGMFYANFRFRGKYYRLKLRHAEQDWSKQGGIFIKRDHAFIHLLKYKVIIPVILFAQKLNWALTRGSD